MAQPTPSDVHVDRPLTNTSILWLQNQDEFIADQVFPAVNVSHETDSYFVYDRDNWFRSAAEKRALSTESAGSGFTLSTDNYRADVYALHMDLDDRTVANQDDPLDLERDATIFVSRDLMLKKELLWAAKYFTTGTWTGSTTGGDVTPVTKWDLGGSTPIEDMRAQFLATKRRTGFRANSVVFGDEVWSVLQDHPDYLDRIKHTQTGIVGLDLLAAVLGVDNVFLAGAVQNTAVEGAAEDMQFVFGKNVLICYSAPSPGLLQPTAGYTFAWTGMFGGEAMGTRVSRFREDRLKSWRIEAEMAFDQKIVSPEMGAFLTAVIS